jgi:small subunit ribosomal protein S9
MMSSRYFYGTGRRKTAVARVRLYPGTGNFSINDKALEEYFPREADRLQVHEPLRATDTLQQFNVVVRVEGGGISGQAGAVRHGIARALLVANPDLRGVLRKQGFLTRDPRAKERKKPGLKRARKAPQYTKR